MNDIKTERYFYLPHIGQRIVKTSIAVFITLLVYYLRGYRGAEMPAEAAITAIICMQPYVRDTRDFAVNRFIGTLIGAAWGLAFLLLMLIFPAIFICVVIAFPEIEAPLQQALERFTGVLLGTCTSIAVNVFRLPRDKERGYVYFVKIADLVPDRFSHLPAAARFRLNYLYDDGAKICLMSEHAPAFFTLTMSQTMLSVPFIVMGGAAIYDANENSYLKAETLDPWEAARLREHLDALGLGYFIYTVHNNKICIFHQGKMHEQERKIYERMKRSPYRSYLEGEIYQANEIVYLKIIDETDKIVVLEKKLESFLAGRKLRVVVRPQQSAPGVSGLYIYADTATFPQAEARLMEILRRKDPALMPREVFLRTPYRSEHDAMVLLHRLGNLYEPLKILRLFPRLKERLEKDE